LAEVGSPGGERPFELTLVNVAGSLLGLGIHNNRWQSGKKFEGEDQEGRPGVDEGGKRGVGDIQGKTAQRASTLKIAIHCGYGGNEEVIIAESVTVIIIERERL
jgi:hypothetical protein